MKKTAKRIFAVLVAATMSLTVAGCKKDPTSGGNQGNDEIFISVVDAGFGSDWLEAVGAAYFEETGTVVSITADPDIGNSVLTKMGTTAEKDDIYFCFEHPSHWRQWTYRGLIEPLDDVLASDKYGVPAKDRTVDNTMLKTGTYYNKTYLTPYVYSNWGIIYNQNYLDKIDSFGEFEKGVWPSTVQGLLDLCKATKNANLVNVRTGRTVSPFACGLTVSYMDPLFYTLWYQLDPEGYNAYWAQNDRNDYDFTALQSDAATKAMETIYDLIGATSETESNLVSSSQSHLESQNSFVNGDCVFVLCGTWFETEMDIILEQVGLTEYHYAAHPVYNAGDKPVSCVNIPGEYFFIPSDAINKEGAKDFLAFAMSEKGLVAASKKLNQPLAFKTEQDVEFSTFGKEINAVVESSEKIYRYSDTDVGKTGALNLFLSDVSPFMSIAKYKVTAKSEIYEKIFAVEISKHQTRWEDFVNTLG